MKLQCGASSPRGGEQVTEAGAVERCSACGSSDQTGCELTTVHLRQPAEFMRSASFIQGEGGGKPREETSPCLRRQTTSRACHEVASATGRDSNPSSHWSVAGTITITVSATGSCLHTLTLKKSILTSGTPLPGSAHFWLLTVTRGGGKLSFFFRLFNSF